MSEEDRLKNVISLVDYHFAEDIASALTSGDGGWDLAGAIANAAEAEDIDDEEAVIRLLGELTALDRHFITGEMRTQPTEPGIYISAKIEAGLYI